MYFLFHRCIPTPCKCHHNNIIMPHAATMMAHQPSSPSAAVSTAMQSSIAQQPLSSTILAFDAFFDRDGECLPLYAQILRHSGGAASRILFLNDDWPSPRRIALAEWWLRRPNKGHHIYAVFMVTWAEYALLLSVLIEHSHKSEDTVIVHRHCYALTSSGRHLRLRALLDANIAPRLCRRQRRRLQGLVGSIIDDDEFQSSSSRRVRILCW